MPSAYSTALRRRPRIGAYRPPTTGGGAAAGAASGLATRVIAPWWPRPAVDVETAAARVVGWEDSHRTRVQRYPARRHTAVDRPTPCEGGDLTHVPTPEHRRPHRGAARAGQARARVRRRADHPGGHRARAQGRV